MIEIYHNARCSKSRDAVNMLEEKGVDYKVVEYLKEHPTPEQLKAVIDKLGIHPSELVRTKEAEWAQYKDQELEEEEYIMIMAETPKLIERPIVIKGNKAVIGRPTEKILELI